jgi:hypothetical protein
MATKKIYLTSDPAVVAQAGSPNRYPGPLVANAKTPGQIEADRILAIKYAQKPKV